MYQGVNMKISKTFRLSSEAVYELSKQPNQSQYIEDLVLGKDTSQPNGPKENRLTEGRVLFLINRELEKTRLAQPKSTAGEPTYVKSSWA